MAGTKPRILHNSKDALWSLIPLAVLCLIFAGLASQCTFSPGGPSQGPIPSFDVDNALKFDAREYDFPVRDPEVPGTWRPNSGTRGPVDNSAGGFYTTVGYITPDGSYIQLTQSNAAEEALVQHIARENRIATGIEQIADTKWVVYAEKGTEPLWIADLGQARVAIKGSAPRAEFVTLATATLQAQPLPRS